MKLCRYITDNSLKNDFLLLLVPQLAPCIVEFFKVTVSVHLFLPLVSICLYICQYDKAEEFISPGFLSMHRIVIFWFFEVI